MGKLNIAINYSEMNGKFYHKTYKNMFTAFIIITKWLPPNSGLKLAAERLSLRIALPSRFGMESVILHTHPFGKRLMQLVYKCIAQLAGWLKN